MSCGKAGLSVIREQFDSDSALRNVMALADGSASRVEQKILYPYFHFVAQCSVPTLAGRKAMSVDCLVDGVTGNGATADPFDCDDVAATDDLVLPATIQATEARRIAHRTVTHRLGKRFKLIAPFNVDTRCVGTIYRGFWIVRVGNGRVMLDSVTGAIQSLGASAA